MFPSIWHVRSLPWGIWIYGKFNSIPSFIHSFFRQNILTGLSMNATCLTRIGRINLERNYFHSLDQTFRTFGDDLHAKNPLAQIQIRNSFFCDCSSSQWIQWIRGHSQMVGSNLKQIHSNFINSKFIEGIFLNSI